MRKKRNARTSLRHHIATDRSGDIFAGRTVRQTSSDTQNAPEGDKRYRISASESFYIMQLMGSWVNVSETAERKVHYRNRLKWVRFENRDYQLQKAAQFKPFISRFLKGGAYAYIGGKQIASVRELKGIDPFPFIYLASSEALSRFNRLRSQGD